MSSIVTQALIVEEKENPTTDYYLPALLSNLGMEYNRVDWQRLESVRSAEYVFIVRYLNKLLISWVYKIKPKRVFYLMDDDLLDWKVLRFLPYKYAWKIFKSSVIYKNWIKNNAITLVSNQSLLEKYKEFDPLIIPPNPMWLKEEELEYNAPKEPFVVAYHATASHREEFVWLSKLIWSMRGEKEIVFEVITSDDSFKYFKNFHNVWTIRQMKWKSYLQFMKLKYRSLSLVINYPNPFNLMRSHVKFFNNLYMGLCGIYTDTFPISRLIKKHSAGIVLSMEQDKWIDAIKSLSSNSQICQSMFLSSIDVYRELKLQAQQHYERLADVL